MGTDTNQCLWCNAATHSKRKLWGPQGKAFEIFEGWLRITGRKEFAKRGDGLCDNIYRGGGVKGKQKVWDLPSVKVGISEHQEKRQEADGIVMGCGTEFHPVAGGESLNTKEQREMWQT